MRQTAGRYFLGGLVAGAAVAGLIVAGIAVVLVAEDSTSFPSVATTTITPSTTQSSTELAPASTTEAALVTTPTAGAGAGAAVYQVHCASCHENPDAESPGPPLRELGAPTEEVIRLVVANGAGMMPGFEETLTPAEIDAVVGYVLDGL